MLPDGESWLWRPMERGYCRYSELVDGTLSLTDVSKMNDVIDVSDENQRRYAKAAAKL